MSCLRLLSFRRFYSSSVSAGKQVSSLDLSLFPPHLIRNFSIIAHIDHGKSTLADRLLEYTGTISTSPKNKQVLDKLEVEKERGITVKAQTASMVHVKNGIKYLLNLIDTPGHVDFSYEVLRSLTACQGSVLVVDACQGIQAQTFANYQLAVSKGLTILPVINKIDLPIAEPEIVALQLEKAFNLPRDLSLKISAKTGLNISSVLDAIVDHIPCPTGNPDDPLRSVIVDSWYDKYHGVISTITVKEGTIKLGDSLISALSGKKYDVVQNRNAGQVGYMILNAKSPGEINPGDTFFHEKNRGMEKFPMLELPKPKVFAGLYPAVSQDFQQLEEAIDKLKLNDQSITIHKETSMALGQGWRIGFLGSLHMEVFKQRLQQEFNAEVLLTQPTVVYKVKIKSEEKLIRTPLDFPSPDMLKRVAFEEPIAIVTIILPEDYLGKFIQLCTDHRGRQESLIYLDEKRMLLKYKIPVAELLSTFHDQVKSLSSGYASFDYEEIGYEPADIVKMDILLNGKPVDVLASIMHRSKSEYLGRYWAKKLKDVLPRQLFEVVIQTVVGGKVIARERLSPFRKDVTAKCYGGDVTRKQKLLNKQKQGKKRMKTFGNVEISQQVLTVLTSSE